MIGRTIGHYHILALIGRGGMGEVYRAHDTRLKRDVALKVLPADVAVDPARLERFQREAETVAGLNHPHIVTVFSVEEADGLHFFTMEFIEGRTLDAVLSSGGHPLAQLLEIGIAVADALAAAHEKGIVHRDLKPANVMIVNDGRIKVLDFGLAKLTHPPARESVETLAAPITAEGAVIGTVPYMSPELLRGYGADHRSDIFSLGVILYQLATGQHPFAGETRSDITSSILRDTPAPIDQIKPDLPHHLARIVSQCLEKEVGNRYHSAVDVRNELRVLRKEMEAGVSEIITMGPVASAPPAFGQRARWIGLVMAVVVMTVAAAVFLGRNRTRAPEGHLLARFTDDVDPHSIAVLPFVNMSSDKEQEYFSEGISEELLNLFTKVPGLKVVARTSSFSFKGKEVEIPEIARQLRVAHVLEGSVRKSGERVRITAQLVHAADGFHLWSRTYNRKLDDIFKIQEEIAADVVKELKVTLFGAVPKARPTDPQAYALYLQARQLGREFSAEAFARSDSLYLQVLAIDSRYAPAWDGLAANFGIEANYGVLSIEEGFARAREAAAKALALDPGFAPAHARLGWIAMHGNDLIGAARHFERALELDPTDLSVLGNAATFLMSLGRLDEALALHEAVVRRDPVNVSALSSLGLAQRWAGRLDAAISSFRTVLSLSPGRGGAHFQLGVALLLKGDAPAALAEIKQETSEVWLINGLPMAYHALGGEVGFQSALAREIEQDEKEGPYNIAYVYAFHGDADAAFVWLEKAVKYGDPGLSDVVGEILFTNIHSDPRWLPFLRKLGKAPEQLAKIEFKVPLLPEEY